MSTGRDGVVVPHAELTAQALRGVVDVFVLREGTDYGESETGHDEKVRQVVAQIERGEAVIVYDADTDSVDIVPVADLPGEAHPDR